MRLEDYIFESGRALREALRLNLSDASTEAGPKDEYGRTLREALRLNLSDASTEAGPYIRFPMIPRREPDVVDA